MNVQLTKLRHLVGTVTQHRAELPVNKKHVHVLKKIHFAEMLHQLCSLAEDFVINKMLQKLQESHSVMTCYSHTWGKQVVLINMTRLILCWKSVVPNIYFGRQAETNELLERRFKVEGMTMWPTTCSVPHGYRGLTACFAERDKLQADQGDTQKYAWRCRCLCTKVYQSGNKIMWIRMYKYFIQL